MEKVLNKFYNFVDKIGKHNVMLILFIFIVTLITGLYTTFSIYTSTDPSEILNGLTTYKFILTDDANMTSVTIPANSQKGIEVTVSNNEDNELKYGIYYSSSDTLTDVSLGYSPNSKHPGTGMIKKNSNYIVTIRVDNKSSSNITIDFGLAFGLPNGGDLALPSGKNWLQSKAYYLSEVPAGSYVAYTGNNGCEGDHCSGANANSSDTSNGYCYDSSYEYNNTGWKVAYSKNGNTYIVSAGAVECMCTDSDGSSSQNDDCSGNASSDEYHFKNLDKISQKYCNSKYVAEGACNSTTVRAINGTDFEQITGTNIDMCVETNSESCGSNNSLINNGGYYWVSPPNASMSLASYIDANNDWFGTWDPDFYANAYRYSYGVRPVIKLDNSIIITGGTGTEDDPYQISVEKTYLNEASVGEYVSYTGNNGCEGDACRGINANYEEGVDNGYCTGNAGATTNNKFKFNGWRIAYIENGSPYIISAGAPECLCSNSDGTLKESQCDSYLSTTDIGIYLDGLNQTALKYCNTKYAADGACTSSTAWAIGETDFTNITGSTLGNCHTIDQSEECGYNNELIDTGGFYRFTKIHTTNSIVMWGGVNRRLGNFNSQSAFGVRPVIKLDSRVTITGGTGTEGDPYQIASNSTYLNQVKVGSYVAYTGNNGCEGDHCSGANANSSSTSNGRCYTDTKDEFNTSGWRVAYIEDGSAYLISAGSPECLCTNNSGVLSTTVDCSNYESTAGLPLHFGNLNDTALKYCNPKYAADGICDNRTTWAMNGTDYKKITGSNLTVKGCFGLLSENCKFSNSLIDINESYWVAKTYDDSSNTTYYNKTTFVINPSQISHNWSSFIRGVRPVIKLDPSVMVTGGIGTEANPYKIVTAG